MGVNVGVPFQPMIEKEMEKDEVNVDVDVDVDAEDVLLKSQSRDIDR